MPKLTDICRQIRSKNAGPFWITVDIFFMDQESLDFWSNSPTLHKDALARRFDVDPSEVHLQLIRELATLKFSYPRRRPQGGALERDMHGGQQFVRLLDLDVSQPS